MGNILHEVQDYVVGKLSADYRLSGNCTFLAENIKDIDYEIKNALGRQGVVGVVMTPKATYAGKYEDLFLAWTLEELEIDIVENPTVNRGKKTGYMTGQDIGLRVFDVLCPLSGDHEGQFCPQTIEEGEDSGLVVNRCILKALVYGEHGDTPQPEPGLNMHFVKLLDGPPEQTPQDGWMWPEDDGFVLWQDGEAHKLGTPFDQISAYVEGEISAKADVSALNAVENSLSDYYMKSETSSATEIQTALDGKQPTGDYALVSQLPTKTSELTNDSGYITSAQVEPATLLAYSGFAQNAVYSNNLKSIDSQTGLISDQGVFTAVLNYSQPTNTYDLALEGSVKVPANWYLISLFGETFSPKLPLEWCKGIIYRKRVIGGTVRWSINYTGWMWLAKGRYAIAASSYDTEDGRLFVLFSGDETHQNCINDPATDVHTLTFTTDNYAKRIDTIDGQTGQASGEKTTYIERTVFSGKLAYEYQISAKADVSALDGYLPAEMYGAHDEFATVKKVVEIQDARSDPGGEPVLTLAQKSSERSLEIIDTSSLATLNFGVLSSGLPRISFGIDDPESFNTVYFQNKSGTLAYLSDISSCLPLSGDVEANVETNYLHSNGIKIGSPNTSGSVGPDPEGINYNGVLIGDGAVEIQNSRTAAITVWNGVGIDGRGSITIKQKDGDGEVVTYDVLWLPKTKTRDFRRTIATEEWTTQTALSSYMKATAMTQAEYDQITPDPATLYVITES